MAPRQMTTAQRNAVSLLSRYKCRVCNAVKGAEHFSNSELNDYKWKKNLNPSMNEVTARLRCRPCAGNQVHELECQGPCGQVKVLSKFSKNSRTRGSNWCEECILWKEAAQPDVETPAAPNNELAPDEDEAWGTTGVVYGEAEDGGGSDDDYDNMTGSVGPIPPEYIGVPYQAFAALSVTNAEEKTAPESSGSTTLQIAGFVPSRLRGISGGPSVRDEQKSQSSISNPYEDMKSSASVTESGWSDVDARRRAPVQFTAYGPNGEVEQRVTSQPSSSGLLLRAGNSNWAKPVGERKPRPQAPAPRQVQNTPHYDSESEDDP